MHKKILVTGGAGFVGSNLCLSFKRDFPDTEVVALDNLKRRGSELNLPRFQDAGVTFVHGDIRNPEDLAAVGAFDLMIECSAEPSVLAGFGGSPAYLLNTNLVGTLNCLEAVREHGADVVFLSTSRVYPMHRLAGLEYVEKDTRLVLKDGQGVPGVSPLGVAENFGLEGARTLYGTTKLASELVLQEYGEMYGVRGLVNRCGVLAGPWQMGKVDQGFMVLWVAKHILGGKLGYIGFGGLGKQVRDVLHVADLYDLLRIQLADFDTHAGRVFNVGGGPDNALSLQELTAMVREITGETIPMGSDPVTRAGDIPWYVTDNARVSGATGWHPTRSLETIVTEIADWIRDNRADLERIL